ncbi:MAG: sulfatase [Candidatus Hydrogenedentes bacterium]|nr:sulfatase [Candidatus Hydrogenedentota bacterium]
MRKSKMGPDHQIPRRSFLGAAAAAVLAGSSARASRQQRPNVIYAFSDEHRWQSMSFTEMPSVKTPHMAQLAADGVEFTHCISNYPVCSPHRAILLTGRWPYQHGVIDNGIPLSPDEVTIGKVFQQTGYHTGYIGKWHLGGTRAEPFGFHDSLIWSDTNVHWDKSSYFPKDSPAVAPKGYNATLMTDQAVEFIRENRRQPFFLMISWNPPHSNFTDAPPDKLAMYPVGSLPLRPNARVMDDGFKTEGDHVLHIPDGATHQGYHAHISAIDDQLGRLLATLEELDLADNTILVYSSDHGSMMGSHDLGSKRQPYEESIRVPFLLRGPGMRRDSAKIDALFGTIDVMPTLCSLAGLNIPIRCAGKDFSAHMRGGRGPDPASQLIMHISKQNASGGEKHPAPIFRGLRTKRYTYAVREEGPWLLFDNHQDPYQLDNLIDDPKYARLRQKLTSNLQVSLRNAHDPFEMPA